ncbi:MAG: radical SAM protein, partial [candidate division NC10 bacterium]
MKFRPDVISWNLTKRCHLNCAHCYLDADFRTGARADELTTRECRDIIDQIAEVNPNALLILTGGEPLLRRDLFDIAGHASHRGFLVVVATTGTLLTPEVTRRMAAAGIRGASISLHSLRPEAHDAFTRVAGSWEKAVRGARSLHAANLPFVLQTSAMSWNADEIPALVDFAARLGARVFDLYVLVCTGRGQGMTDISPAQHEALLVRLYELQKIHEGRMSIGARCAPQNKRIVYQADPQSPHLRAYTGGCP